MLGSAFGDHLNGASRWLDDRSHRGGMCPRCGSDQTLERNRAASAPDMALHRHAVLACLDCLEWSAVCFSVVSEPEVIAWA